MKALKALCLLLLLSGCGDVKDIPTAVSSSRGTTSATRLHSSGAVQVEGLIYWEQRRELSWSDFQGPTDPSSPRLAQSEVGASDIQIISNPDGSFEIRGAETIFDPSKSWVLPGSQTDALLVHEQGHFDLEETAVRDFRAAVNRAAAHESGDRLQATLNRLVERFKAQSDNLHARYDRETNYGLDPDKQAKWTDRIERELGPLPPPCSPGAIRWPGNGHCYEAVPAAGISWTDAQAACAARGGHLATISSAEEDAFIIALIANNPDFWFVDGFNNGLGPWIGGFQPGGSTEPAGGWTWVTGEPWAYTNWASGEPNNCCGGQDRLRYFKANNTLPVRWDDCESSNPTAHRRGYIFESD
jgi:lectin-like protein/uncharacterized protein DUF922